MRNSPPCRQYQNRQRLEARTARGRISERLNIIPVKISAIRDFSVEPRKRWDSQFSLIMGNSTADDGINEYDWTNLMFNIQVAMIPRLMQGACFIQYHAVFAAACRKAEFVVIS